MSCPLPSNSTDKVLSVFKRFVITLGAHGLILHILEPSLERRATLRDIATHHWLQDGPRQDPNSLCVSRRSNGNVSPSIHGSHLRRSGSRENISSSLTESDVSWNQFSWDNCPTALPVVGASSFYDSLFIHEAGGQSPLVSCRHGSNLESQDMEGASAGHVADDYIPLHDSSVVDRCLQLSSDKPCQEYSEDDCFGNRLISTPHSLSDFHFQPKSDSVSHERRCHPSSYADRNMLTVSSDVSSVIATRNKMAKLPVSFSADSLEFSASAGNCNNSCVSTGGDDITKCRQLSADNVSGVRSLVDDDDDAENSLCDNYDFSDIDAVLDHIAGGTDSTEAYADASSRVSCDSLEDAV